MKVIIVTSQEELDALPDEFDEYTVIRINSPAGLWLTVRRAWDNSSVEALGNSSVEAWGNSSVEALDNSSVVALENSFVEARGNSSVEARGNSSVEALENSFVEAWDNSSVEALGNSSVEAWDNSSVEARGNSSVEALGNSIIRILSDSVKIKTGHQAVVVCQDCRPQIIGDANLILIRTTQFTHDLNSFAEIYPETDGRITLYKSVRPDTHRDFQTGKIKYEGRVVCPDFDPDTSRQCGGGLHLSPKPYLAKQYNDGTILECRVPLKYTDDAGVEHDNIVVYGKDITKVRCREVEVVGVWDGK